MKFLCDILGHRGIGNGWWGDGLHGRVEGGGLDNLGVRHWRVTDECGRCSKRFTLAHFHTNSAGVVFPAIEKIKESAHGND